ncbi:hypothetical protein H1R20_g9875, partial [Candolleomyces eurysporus]
MPKPEDIFVQFHDVMRENPFWKPGEPATMPRNPGLFVSQVLQLVTHMHGSKAKVILEYPAARMLCSWVGHVLLHHCIPDLAKQPLPVATILANLDTTLPDDLPELSTVPPTLRAHLDSQETAKKGRKVAPRPIKKVTDSGSRVFSLNGSPTSVHLLQKKSKAASEAPSTTSRKRGRADVSPSPVKKEKSEPLPKPKRLRQASPEPQRALRPRGPRQDSPVPSKSLTARGKQRATSPPESEVASSSEEEVVFSAGEEEQEDAEVNASFAFLNEEDVDELVSSSPEGPPLAKKWTAKRKGKKVVSAPRVVDDEKEEGSSRKAPTTPPPKPSARSKPKPVVEIPATPSTSRPLKTVVPREDRTLTERAIRVYENLAPPSVFLSNPEAATLLLTRPESLAPLRLPCRSRACLADPSGCLPHDGKSEKCAPCQKSRTICSWTRNQGETLLHEQLRGYWDLARGPSNASYMNNLYSELRHHWEAYRSFQTLAHYEATRFESVRRFIASYVETMVANDDPFVDQVIDQATLQKLILEFPNVAYEPRARVAPVSAFLNLPSAPGVFPSITEESSVLGSPFAPIPGFNIHRQGPRKPNAAPHTPGSSGANFPLRPVSQPPHHSQPPPPRTPGCPESPKPRPQTPIDPESPASSTPPPPLVPPTS